MGRGRGLEDNYSMKDPGDHCSDYKILNKTVIRMNYYSYFIILFE